VSGYIDAMKQTFILPIAFLFLTALSALLIKRDRAAAAAAQPKREEARAAAG
jgi:hypothetical protein